MKITSAAANKLLQSLNEKRSDIITLENKSKEYYVIDGKASYIPEYSFTDTTESINRINEAILKLKHALYVFNSTTVVENMDITIDVALVKMKMLTDSKARLDRMRNKLESEMEFGYDEVQKVRKLNYKPSEIDKEYKRIASELKALKLNLDLTNLTKTFEVELNNSLDEL